MQERIYGEGNPVLEIILNPDESVRSWAADCAWMTSSVEMTQDKGAEQTWLGKMFGRKPQTTSSALVTFRAAKTPGMVAFTTRVPGEIVTVDVRNDPGTTYLCAVDALLCAEDGVEITRDTELTDFGTGMYGGGFSLLLLDGIGKAWIGVGGTSVAYDLRPDETIRVHPGHLALVQDSVDVAVDIAKDVCTPSFPDGVRLLAVTGPGRVWLSSLGVGPLAESLDDFTATVDLPGAARPGAKQRGVLRDVLFPRP